MTLKQLFKHQLTIKWKINYCHTGKDCWCRIIIPEKEILHEEKPWIIVGSGSIGEDLAKHIVKTHNKFLST